MNSPSRSSPRPPLAACLLVALGALLAPRHAAAQHRATLDFGLARISQADIVDEAALTFAYYLESRYSRLTFASSGIGSLATGGQSAAQGGVGAFWLLPRSPLGIPELSASLSAARFQDGEGATARSVALRQIWGGVRHGVWLGGRTGDVLSQGNRFGTHSIEAGSWIVGRGVELSATLSTTWTRTATWHFDPIGQQSVITVPVRYADAAVRARLERPRFELEVSGTARRGILNAEAFDFAAHGAATWHFNRRLALTIAAGDHLRDPTRGVPATGFAMVALRITALGERGKALAAGKGAGAAVTVSAEAGGALRVHVYGDAKVVEVMGAFSGWQPLRLERDGDVWLLPRRLQSGLHRILVRVDGGEWRTPDNLPRAEDEFGTMVGLLVVP
ncbi:MAG: glycogen-binding domain-containing protein [bacterium]|nr:MAG: hypothetical protein DIU52_02895 [bacterium]